MKNKKIILLITTLIIMIIGVTIYFFTKNTYKNTELGNNNIDDIKEYILNISSYYSESVITINSNKNTNKYVVKQSYISPNIFKQEVIEPSNIKGLTITYDGQNLEIKNNKNSLSKVYENYPYLCENNLDLCSFIEEYKKEKNVELQENEKEIVMKITNSKEIKKLYIDKNTIKPTKLEISDRNEKTLVYILYNEIRMNSEAKEDVLASNLKLKI